MTYDVLINTFADLRIQQMWKTYVPFVSPILITSTCSALIVALLRQIWTLNKLSLKTSSLLRWDGGDGHDVDDHDHLHNRWHHHGDLACGVDLASFYGGG